MQKIVKISMCIAVLMIASIFTMGCIDAKSSDLVPTEAQKVTPIYGVATSAPVDVSEVPTMDASASVAPVPTDDPSLYSSHDKPFTIVVTS